MTNPKFDGTIYDGLSDYHAMDKLIDAIVTDGRALERIQYFMTLVTNKELLDALKDLATQSRVWVDIAESLRKIRDGIAQCDCEECNEPESDQDQDDDWDEWKGWGTGMECFKCGAGELRIEYDDIWCSNKDCRRSGHIEWHDKEEETTTA